MAHCVSRYFQLPTSYWGPQSGVEVYGKKYPIQDCRSGVCYDGWLYYNGYIPANRVNSTDPATGRPNGVMGVPTNYKPFQTPIIPTPANGGSSADPNFPFYETNNVVVPLQEWRRATSRLSIPRCIRSRTSTSLGPMIWNMAASAFKTIPITERVFLRVNADFLENVFNMPGTTMPGDDGVILNRNSANPPRVLQLTMRLTW